MEITNLNKDRKNRRKPSIDLSTMVYGKVPPQAKELEEAILGAMLIDSNCLPDIMNLIFKEVFYVNAHQLVFEAIGNLYDKSQKIDILTVCDELKKTENLDNVGGVYAVTKLTNSVVSSANIEAHCRIILEMYLKREAIRICGETIGESYEDGTDGFEVLEKADAEILQVQEKVLSGTVKDMRFYSVKLYDQYETVKQTGTVGINTGIVPFDRIFSGLVAPDLFVIAARPGQGKTAFALSLTHALSVERNIPCAWFSLEMDGIQLSRRLTSIDSNIPHELIRQGKVFEDLESKLYNSFDRIGDAPIFIEDKGVINIRSIRTRSNVLVRKNNIKFIVVDYLQLMSSIGKKGQTRENEVSEISRGLKLLAKELNIPVIALSQLSRKVEERTDKLPQLSDLRESGAIEQDADEVMFLMRPEYYHMEAETIIGNKEYHPQGLCIGKGDKNRHGECRNFAMWFDAPIMKFSTHPNDVDTSNYYSNSWKPATTNTTF